ncbi:MAG: acyl-CoA dehydrogenase [Acidimicrobiales bacterium]|nr:acyl-CoA dehydrogenase [Acidimicrobiales bacterium]
MDFAFPPHAEAFRTEVREFLAANITPETLDVSDGTIHDWDLHQKMAAKGWLSGAVPEELIPPDLGGGDRDLLEMAVLIEELQLAGAPADGLGVAVCVASMVLELGNDFLKETVAGPLLRGEVLASFGYSEPESGSDVAAAQTKAARDGDHWVINGQKMWTTLAHEAAFVILLTRTNAEVPKHKGLTMFLVPLDAPGIEIQPVWTMGTERSNATFYDDVRIGDEWRIGEVDGGWAVMKAALKYERGIAGGQFPSAPLLDAAITYCRTTTDADGRLLIDDPTVREQLVRARIDIEVCRGFAYKTAWMAAQGDFFGVEGSMTKLFASESYKQHAHWILDLMGPEGLLQHGADAAPLGGSIEEHWRHAPVTTIYGGTSQITRNLVAEQHLGLPRARR